MFRIGNNEFIMINRFLFWLQMLAEDHQQNFKLKMSTPPPSWKWLETVWSRQDHFCPLIWPSRIRTSPICSYSKNFSSRLLVFPKVTMLPMNNFRKFFFYSQNKSGKARKELAIFQKILSNFCHIDTYCKLKSFY